MTDKLQHPLTATELVSIRQACARGIAECEAGLAQPDSDELFKRIMTEAAELSTARRRDRER